MPNICSEGNIIEEIRMDLYKFIWPNGVIQEKLLIPHDIFLEWKKMPETDSLELYQKKNFWKMITTGKEWFTDKSPLFDSITTGILNCNGSYKVKIWKIH